MPPGKQKVTWNAPEMTLALPVLFVTLPSRTVYAVV